MILEQFHVVQKTAAGIAALDQVVAEDPVLGQAVAKHDVKGLDIVNAFPLERPLP